MAIQVRECHKISLPAFLRMLRQENPTELTTQTV